MVRGQKPEIGQISCPIIEKQDKLFGRDEKNGLNRAKILGVDGKPLNGLASKDYYLFAELSRKYAGRNTLDLIKSIVKSISGGKT